jgi:hypothetical protein
MMYRRIFSNEQVTGWPENSPRRLARATEAAAPIVVMISGASVIAFCLFALDRGFEITDEAYYVLLAMYPHATKIYISAQQWISAPLWHATGTLALFRGTGLFLLVGSSALLAQGTRTTLERSGLNLRMQSSWVFLAAATVSALLYIATINLSPCYNLLASAGAYAATGLALFAVHTQTRRVRIALLLGVGGALCVEFVSKPSAGMATFGLLSAGLILLAPTVRQGIFCIVLSGLFFVLSVVALALSNQSPGEIRASLSTGLEMFRMVQTESVGLRLLRYVTDITTDAGDAMLSFAIPIACVSLYLLTRRAVFVAISAAVLCFTLLRGGYILGGTDQYLREVKAELVVLLCALAVSLRVWSCNRRAAVMFLGLTLLPYSIALGTGNSLFTQIIDSMAPWGVLVAVLASLQRDKWSDWIMQQMLMGVFVAAIASQIVTSGFRAPYNLAEPLVRQSKLARVGHLGRLRVDAGTVKFVKDIDEAVKACGLAQGAPFLGFYNLPGVALALRTVPIVTPWINTPAQAIAILSIEPLEPQRPLAVAVLKRKDGSRAELPAALAAFPAGFSFCGEATYPFDNQSIEIWWKPPSVLGR